MDFKLKPFDFEQALARAGLGVDGAPKAARLPALGVVETDRAASFGDALAQALGNVSQAQTDSAQLQRRFSLEDPNVSLEQVMISSEKAKLGFSAAVSVRNRLVQAYSEIMHMQV